MNDEMREEYNYHISECEYGISTPEKAFQAAYQLQQTKLDKAVEALEDIANRGVSQSAAMNMPEEQWAWRCFNNLQYEARKTLAEIKESK